MQRLLFISFFTVFGLFAQEDRIWMHPNKGQWENNILYRVDLTGGKMYLEQDGFTYLFYESPRDHGNLEFHEHAHEEKESLKAHSVKTRFINASTTAKISDSEKSYHYLNYFLGEKNTWKSAIHGVSKVNYQSFYKGIDLELDGNGKKLKYSFVVHPFSNVNQIQMQIDGADKCFIDSEGNLHIQTSLGEIIEEKPIAWNLDSKGIKTNVGVKYKLLNNIVSYEFPDSYDISKTLIIDPDLVFSTFTGSTSDNWGMTATPGPNGETYAGGISFGVGYPLTTGAFDLTYGGGSPNGNMPGGYDVAISKFNVNGTQLLFSTYLGGAGNELPESMIAGANGDLYILGITSSTNFPVGPTPYDNSYGGGIAANESGLLFTGSDIFIAKFNSLGTTLLGSTFIGGVNNDGLNASNLSYNYGDGFRGEIIIDGQENVYVASHTQSADFPVTIPSTLQGTQDAVLFKMNSTLSTLIWSRYFGGGALETGNSLELSTTNELFVSGGTSSSGLSFVGADGVYGGGIDGYLAKFNATTGAFITGTYMGDGEYDQCYFVKLDIDNNPYVYGQTETSWAITPGKYGNPNSGQFLRKYDNSLATVTWTTMIGSGSGHPEISPTALLVSDCYDIFFAGWGGTVNSSNSDAIFSSSLGFPVTSDAYQLNTNGSNFYLGILGNDAANLIYGTYMGGSASSSNHVDGGTSRFDKSGAVYHAVCAGCGGNDFGFTSTPGVWSPSNPSPNCNLAAFKFQLGLPYSLSPNSTICSGVTTQLSATGGTSYSWTPVASLSNPNSANPIASPSQTTVYYVSMDFNEGCSIVDSIIVTVIEPPLLNINANTQICQGDTTTLNAQGNGNSYSWSPNTNISATNVASVDVWPTTSMYYYCTITNTCFTNTDSIYVNVYQPTQVIASNDTIICQGNTALLTAYASLNPTWQAHSTLTVVNATQANVTPTTPMYYYAIGFDSNGCINRDSVRVSFFPIPPITISNDTAICFQSSTTLQAAGGTSYSWSPGSSLSNPSISNPIATPLVPTDYQVSIGYGQSCFLNQDVFIDLLYLPVPILLDTVFACYGVPKQIIAGGATSYTWTPADYLDIAIGPIVFSTPPITTTYLVEFTNVCGTTTEDVVVVPIRPEVNAYNDTIVCPFQPAYLYATGGITYLWTPSNTLSSGTAASVIAIPTEPTNYLVIGNDQYGCIDSAFVFVDLFPRPYIKASPDAYLLEGDVVQLSATSSTSGPYVWSPSEYLSCVNCVSPIASPPVDYQYIVSYTDENGCTDSDDVWIYFKPLIWVPNTFTPNGTGINDGFRVEGGNVRNLELMVFNRWGELVKTLHGIEDYWDGTYKGVICQDGTYTWKMSYKDLRGNVEERVGHVNLVR